MKPGYTENVGKFIRSCHPHAFRSGIWAEVVAVYILNNRPCYAVIWPEDGALDLWVCEDSAAEYEFKDTLDGV